MHLDLELFPTWTVHLQIVGPTEFPSHPVHGLGQRFLLETESTGQVLEINSIPTAAKVNCTRLHRITESPSPSSVNLPRFALCNLLFLHVFAYETDFQKLFVHGSHCPIRPVCSPLHNWHYLFLTHSSNMTLSRNTLLSHSIPKTVKSVIQNALLFHSPQRNPLYLIRDKWKEFQNLPEIHGAPNNSARICLIKNHAFQQITNYELETIFIISPFSIPPVFVEEYKRSIIRGEKGTYQDLLTAYAIIERVNGTPALPPFVGLKGLVPALENNSNSISIRLAVNEERWKSIEYSQIYARSRIGFIVQVPRPAGNDFTFLVKPFRLQVWLALLTSFVALGIFGAALLVPLSMDLQSTSPPEHQKIGPFKNFSQSVTFVMKILILPLVDQSGNLNKGNSNIQLRFLFGVWSLMVIVLGSLYRSGIVSFLVQPAYTSPPDNFKDLLSSGFRIKLADGFSDLAIRNLKLDLMRMGGVDLDKRLEISSRIKCFTDVMSGDNACINYDFMINIIASLFLTDEEGRTLYINSGDLVYPTYLATPISPGSDIKPSADKVISQLLSSGLLNKWLVIYSELNKNQGRKQALADFKNGTKSGHSQSLQLGSFSTLVYPMYILIAGLVGSFIIFAYEFGIYGKLKKTYPNLKFIR